MRRSDRWLGLALVLACADAHERSAPVAPKPAASPALPAVVTPEGVRLPSTATPRAYRLELDIDPSEERFRGTVEIDVELSAQVDVLWLNADGLELGSATVASGASEEPTLPTPIEGKRTGLRLTHPRGPGSLTVRIQFSGPMSEREDLGIFRRRSGGDWYVFTQFEAIAARRAFPCFDDPAHKTPWQITLRVPAPQMAVANAPVERETPSGDGRKVVRFRKTEPLPSYLVAFAVGPFDVRPAGFAGTGKTPVRVITPRGRAGEAGFAATAAVEILARLEAYTGIPYPYQKLDLLALPLAAGGMENVGLITIGETRLLAPPSEEGTTFQRRLGWFQAHELAHLWFGDLVTSAWWDDIWLNESFANWMAAKILEDWRPAWRSNLTYLLYRDSAATGDTLTSARQIRQPILSDDDIENAFDDITYSKGASVLRMFEIWLGEQVFQRGVQQYLSARMHGTASVADLIGALSRSAGRDLAPAFSSFLDQPGVPRLRFTLHCPRGRPPTMLIEQARLLPGAGRAQSSALWQVPVCLRMGKGTGEQRQCTLLVGRQAEVELPGECPDWVVPNDRFAGYYRSVLHGDLHERLLRSRRSLGDEDAVGLLDDARAIANAGQIPISVPLRLSEAFATARAREVVQAAVWDAGVREDFLPGALAGRYAAWVRRHFGARARSLGFSSRAGDDDEMRLLRRVLVPFVAQRGVDHRLIEKAQALAGRWLQSPSAVDADAAPAVLATAAWFGGRPVYQNFVKALSASEKAADRRMLIEALASFRDVALASDVVGLIGTQIPGKEAIPYLWTPVPESMTAALWRSIDGQWDRLAGALPRDKTLYLLSVASGFCDAGHRSEVQSAVQPRVSGILGGPRELAQTLERIDQCIDLRAVQVPELETFFGSRLADSARTR
jgi:alanyl aminopeptidase